jgi:hypothetical protein
MSGGRFHDGTTGRHSPLSAFNRSGRPAFQKLCKNLPDAMPDRLLPQSFFVPLVLLIGSFGKSDDEHRRNADAFAKAIPLLESEDVTLLMNEDW